jgi:hypothetical protein
MGGARTRAGLCGRPLSLREQHRARLAAVEDRFGRMFIEGDQIRLVELLGLLDPPHPNFAIITP